MEEKMEIKIYCAANNAKTDCPRPCCQRTEQM